jgi:hypothetical protein
MGQILQWVTLFIAVAALIVAVVVAFTITRQEVISHVDWILADDEFNFKTHTPSKNASMPLELMALGETVAVHNPTGHTRFYRVSKLGLLQPVPRTNYASSVRALRGDDHSSIKKHSAVDLYMTKYITADNVVPWNSQLTKESAATGEPTTTWKYYVCFGTAGHTLPTTSNPVVIRVKQPPGTTGTFNTQTNPTMARYFLGNHITAPPISCTIKLGYGNTYLTNGDPHSAYMDVTLYHESGEPIRYEEIGTFDAFTLYFTVEAGTGSTVDWG